MTQHADDESQPKAVSEEGLLPPAVRALEGVVLRVKMTLNPAEVARLVGFPEGYAPEPQAMGVLADAMARVRSLAEPRGVFRVLAPSMAPHVGLTPADAPGLAIGLTTVGGSIEAEAERAMAEGQAFMALALEAAGSAAVEETTDILSAFIVGDPGVVLEGDTLAAQEMSIPSSAAAELARTRASKTPRHHPAACRFSPGYGTWRLEDQSLLLALLPAEELGVTLLPSMMMVPRKSVSFGMWLGGPEGRAPLGGCKACSLLHCRFRRRT